MGSIVHKCIAMDLEVGRESGRIHRFAAIRGDKPERPFVYSGGRFDVAVRKLEEFAEGAEFVVGHNIIGFDLPHLRMAAPESRLLRLPPIDTLRLSPLAFPRHPYHRLVKHYKDGGLLRNRLNNPELDTRMSLDLLVQEEMAFAGLREANPDLLLALHWLTSCGVEAAGFDGFFAAIRTAPRPVESEGYAAVERFLNGSACPANASAILRSENAPAWPMAYALAWISVAGGNSVMPPWVRHEFPDAARTVRQLRDVACGYSACEWCQEHHNPRRVLKRWFGFREFRPAPACEDGESMQEAIVSASMRGEHVLGILPTGTGKSVCYQVPALSRYENTGALTIVISPLVALMADQVYGMQARGVMSCAALNGLLSMPERADVLERIRLGDIAILLVSPEQLRNHRFRKAVQQREIGAWVLDEAHCLSKWGHDFRTDYRYVGRFIKESAGNTGIPPILCLTATAKPDVVDEIKAYFKAVLGISLRVFNGGASRENLEFTIAETTPAHKLYDIHHMLENELPPDQPGGAIIYCATRRQTDIIASFLAEMGWRAANFHAGLQPEAKKTIQQQFIGGEIRVIAATNAFGMGIDKPDVRLVIHADIPGSLENYVQEAGRAGRDQQPARCVLLYCEEDTERQFGLSARSRLPRHEIQAVLRALRRLAGKRRKAGEDAEVNATAGEILAEDDEQSFMRDSATDDTRVRTALCWLEEAGLVSREENTYQVFPSTLRVLDLDEADERMAAVPTPYQGQLRAIVELLLQAEPTEGVTTDELMGVSRLSSSGVAKAMTELERYGIVSNDSIFTAFVHAGVENSSQKRFEYATSLESTLISLLRELAPDLEKGSSSFLHLRRVAQRLKDEGYAQALPERIHRLLRGIEQDGRSDEGGIGSIRLGKIDAESILVTLQRDWETLSKTTELRRAACKLLLDHLLACLPANQRGNDLLSESTIGNLHEAVASDLALKAQVKDMHRLMERSLLWLHEQEILRLGRGLVVFRPAMTIKVNGRKSPFTRYNYAELQDHYHEQIVQIHVMAKYANQGLQATREALKLIADYFNLTRDTFLSRWFPQSVKELKRQTTSRSWKAIVGALDDVQRSIVMDERENTNVLVLAGPGSGKTRVLVHRIAFLVRVQRENPRGILALAYNRHAAGEIRRRLRELIGDDANGVTVLTCHGLAMRLTGASFSERVPDDNDFSQVLTDAVKLLEGGGQAVEDADEQRERLLAGFRWIFVDEYQDIGPNQYQLISALVGRTLNDADRKLSLFAVGDDDQNVYEFAGASVKYIRQFQEDYDAKPTYLISNYRSSAGIIETSNAFIAPARQRMKTEHPIKIDKRRQTESAGGEWQSLDPVVQGRVHILDVGSSFTGQAVQVMREMLRLSKLDPAWDWSRAAVIAREWKLLNPVHAFCETNGIPVHRADRRPPHFWRLRETQRLVGWLSERGSASLPPADLDTFLAAQPSNPWWSLLAEAIDNYRLECGAEGFPASHLREWLAEWGREIRQRQRGLLLVTAHRVKGLESDHVAVLDGNWEDRESEADPDAARRLLYVAMTRARKTLTLARMNRANRLLNGLARLPSVIEREAPPTGDIPRQLDCLYQVLTPKDVDLGFAGRQSSDAAVHRALANIQPGDPLRLVQKGGRWFIETNGQSIGRLAAAYKPPANTHCINARAHAVLTWSRNYGDQTYADSTKCDRWEVILPELVFTKSQPLKPAVEIERTNA